MNKILLALFCFALGLSFASAQVRISYPEQAKDVTSCLGQDTLWVRLDVTNTTI